MAHGFKNVVKWTMVATGGLCFLGFAQAAEPEQRQDDLRSVAHANTDYAQLEQSRDPFACLMPLSKKGGDQPLPTDVRGANHPLAQLQLVAVITQGETPLAMFRTPSGFGLIVHPGEYLSKSAVRIDKIIDNQVIINVFDRANGKSTSQALTVSPKPELRFVQER